MMLMGYFCAVNYVVAGYYLGCGQYVWGGIGLTTALMLHIAIMWEIYFS